MSERIPENRMPVVSCMDLAQLDEAEIMKGFLDAYEGLPCGDNRSRSYWHGWRSGALDKNMRKRDRYDDIFFADYFKSGAAEGQRRVAAIREALTASASHKDTP